MSSNIKCFTCKKEFPSVEFSKHELECVSHFYKNEMENLIPCDVCNNLITFEKYEQHINFCGLGQPIYFPITPTTESILNTSNTNTLNIEDNEMPPLIEDSNITIPSDLATSINLLMNSQNALLNFISTIEQSTDTYEELTLLDDNNVNKGLKVNDISKEVFYEEFNCPLCFDDFKKEDTIIQLKCKHEICLDCGNEWFLENNKCPICMIELDNS
jgi:hypothetical protein